MGLEMQNSAAEIKLRAERKAGGMLAKYVPHEGGRPIKKPSHNGTVFNLSKFEITRNQSHRWQSIAALPKEDFEGYIRLHRNRLQVPHDGINITSVNL